MNDFIVPVSLEKQEKQENTFQDYFQYVVEVNGLLSPNHWRETVSLYNQLLIFAEG